MCIFCKNPNIKNIECSCRDCTTIQKAPKTTFNKKLFRVTLQGKISDYKTENNNVKRVSKKSREQLQKLLLKNDFQMFEEGDIFKLNKKLSNLRYAKVVLDVMTSPLQSLYTMKNNINGSLSDGWGENGIAFGEDIYIVNKNENEMSDDINESGWRYVPNKNIIKQKANVYIRDKNQRRVFSILDKRNIRKYKQFLTLIHKEKSFVGIYPIKKNYIYDNTSKYYYEKRGKKIFVKDESTITKYSSYWSYHNPLAFTILPMDIMKKYPEFKYEITNTPSYFFGNRHAVKSKRYNVFFYLKTLEKL